MNVSIPGGPYSAKHIRLAAPELEMDAPIDTDGIRDDAAYFLSWPGGRGVVKPIPASPAAVLQATRLRLGIDWYEFADVLRIDPWTLADWIDGNEEPRGVPWDMALRSLAAGPSNIRLKASAEERFYLRTMGNPVQDERLRAKAMARAGAPVCFAQALDVFVDNLHTFVMLKRIGDCEDKYLYLLCREWLALR